MKSYIELEIKKNESGQIVYKIPTCAKYRITNITVELSNGKRHTLYDNEWMLIGPNLLFTINISDDDYKDVNATILINFVAGGISRSFRRTLLIVPYVTYHIVFTDIKWSESHHPSDSRFSTPNISGSQSRWELFRWINDHEGHRGNINYSTIFNNIKICHT